MPAQTAHEAGATRITGAASRRPFQRPHNPRAATVLAIFFAAIVYTGLATLEKIVRQHEVRPAAASSGDERVLRPIDGVVRDRPAIERPPPPSPEALAARRDHKRAGIASTAATRDLAPVLVLASAPASISLSIQPPPLAPLPPPAADLVAATKDASTRPPHAGH